MSVSICLSNLDCLPYETNKLCYINFTQDNIELDANGCACNANYGWTGSNCDELGITSWVIIGSMLVCLFAGIVISCCTSFLLYHERFSKRFLVSTSSNIGGKDRRQSIVRVVKSDRGLTISLTFIAAVFAIGWSLTRFLSTFIRTGGPALGLSIDSDGFTKDDYGRYGRFEFFQEFIFTPISLTFGFLGVVNVPLIWIEISRSTRQLALASTNPSIIRKRRLIRLFQISVVVLVISGNLIDRVTTQVSSIVGFFLLAIGLGVIVLYIVGFRNLTRLMRSNSSSSDYFAAVIANVRDTTLICTLGMLFFSTSWFLQSLLDTLFDLRTLVGLFPVDVSALLESITMVSVNLVLLGITMFLWRSRDGSRNRIKQDNTFGRISKDNYSARLQEDSVSKDSNKNEENLQESIHSSSDHGPPRGRNRRIKSPRDMEEPEARNQMQPFVQEEIVLPGERASNENEDEEEKEPQPYENVPETIQGPPVGRKRRIKSPRAKREEEADRRRLELEKEAEEQEYDLEATQRNELYDEDI